MESYCRAEIPSHRDDKGSLRAELISDGGSLLMHVSGHYRPDLPAVQSCRVNPRDFARAVSWLEVQGYSPDLDQGPAAFAIKGVNNCPTTLRLRLCEPSADPAVEVMIRLDHLNHWRDTFELRDLRRVVNAMMSVDGHGMRRFNDTVYVEVMMAAVNEVADEYKKNLKDHRSSISPHDDPMVASTKSAISVLAEVCRRLDMYRSPSNEAIRH